MSHYCALCKTELRPGARACGVCGTKVEDAVLADANAPNAATVEPLQEQSLRSEPGGKGNDAFLVTPLAPGALPAKGRKQGMLWKIGGCLSAVMLLGVAGWGVYTLWMLGPGGAIGASYHNSAGNAAFQQGDFNGANVHYSEMITLRPRQVDGYLLRAISAYRAGRYPQAIRDNTSALALTDSPMTRGGLYFNRAEAYSNRREWLKAVADYTAAEQAYIRAGDSPTEYAQDKARLPDWMAGMRRGRARANLQLKEYARTIADYKTNVANGNFLPEDYGMCATAEAALGQNKEAVADYGHAIRIDPGYLYGYQGLDRVIGQTHQVDQAVAAYRLATQAHPENVLCRGTLGWYEYAAGYIPEAIATDLRALSLDASQGWINYNLGLSYAVSGDSERARDAYAAALANNIQTNRMGALGELRKALNEHPGVPALQMALKQMETAIAQDPHKPQQVDANVRRLPSFEAYLAPSLTLRGYAIRPPLGYTLKQKSNVYLSGTDTVDVWQGATRADGTTPSLQIHIFEDDGRLAQREAAPQRVQMYLDGIANNHSDYKTSPITTLGMENRTFYTATWSGKGTKTGKQFTGVIYIAMRTGELVEISLHTATSDETKTLPLLKASMLTLRK